MHEILKLEFILKKCIEKFFSLLIRKNYHVTLVITSTAPLFSFSFTVIAILYFSLRCIRNKKKLLAVIIHYEEFSLKKKRHPVIDNEE